MDSSNIFNFIRMPKHVPNVARNAAQMQTTVRDSVVSQPFQTTAERARTVEKLAPGSVR